MKSECRKFVWYGGGRGGQRVAIVTEGKGFDDICHTCRRNLSTPSKWFAFSPSTHHTRHYNTIYFCASSMIQFISIPLEHHFLCLPFNYTGTIQTYSCFCRKVFESALHSAVITGQSQRKDEIKEIRGGCGGSRTKDELWRLLEEVGKSRFLRPRIFTAGFCTLQKILYIHIISF